MLLVHYELTDRESGQVLWKENIYTQVEMSTSDVSAGEVRVVRLLEKGLIANMDALIKRLENYLINCPIRNHCVNLFITAECKV